MGNKKVVFWAVVVKTVELPDTKVVDVVIENERELFLDECIGQNCSSVGVIRK